MTYTLKEFARLFNTSEHTLRWYTDIGLLPCRRGAGNRRIFDDESFNWMQGITCLKGCGASIEDIREYGRLCLLPESHETLTARYEFMLRQRERAYERIEEARATAAYMDEKVRHYEEIIAGLIPDDSNPASWTAGSRPERHVQGAGEP